MATTDGVAGTVLVTGAAKRLGRAIALDLAQCGHDIAVHFRHSGAAAEETATEIRALGRRAVCVQADLTDAAAISRIVAEAAACGPLVGVVAAAAVFRRTPWRETAEADWDFHLDANLKSTFLLARATAPKLQPGGFIITFGDWSALRPYKDFLPYCVSKAGVVALTKALAQELAPAIRVNCICPGTVLPPPHAAAADLDRIRDQTPLQRLGSPADVVAAVRFLAHGTQFATGSVIVVDGGRLIANADWA